MLIVKIISVILCGICDAIGGYSNHNFRRFIMPCVLAVTVSISTHILWLGLLVLPVIGVLVLGYKRFGEGNFSRGMWLFVVSVAASLGLLLTGHLTWYYLLIYTIGSGVLGGSLVSLWQPLGDFIEGCWLGMIVVFVH